MGWTEADADVAKGEVGTVVGFLDSKVTVKFAKGVFHFPPEKLLQDTSTTTSQTKMPPVPFLEPPPTPFQEGSRTRGDEDADLQMPDVLATPALDEEDAEEAALIRWLTGPVGAES